MMGQVFLLLYMPDRFLTVVGHCQFYVLGAGFLVFVSLVYLYGVLIGGWKYFDSFEPCFYTLLGKPRTAFSPGLISLHF